MVLICIFLTANDAEYLVICIFAICVYTLLNCLFMCFTQLLIRFILIVEFWKLYILDTSPLLYVWFIDIFSHSVTCLFTFLTESVADQKFFILMKFKLPFLPHIEYIFGINSESYLPSPRSWGFSPVLFFNPKSL